MYIKVTLMLYGPYCRPLVMMEVGPLANPRLFVFIEGATVQFKWQVPFKTLTSGEFSATTVEPHLEQLKPVSDFKVCPGIKEYPQEIRFETKNLRRWGIPLVELMPSLVHSGIFPTISIIQQEKAFETLVNLVGFFTMISPSWLRKQAL